MGLAAFLSRPGRAVVRIVHGDARTRQGYLRIGGSYVLPGQEPVLGTCYLGLLAAPLFLACVFYIAWTYGEPRGPGGPPQARSASWSAMPTEARVLLVVAIAAWAIFFASMLRLVFLKRALAEQPVSDLE